MSAHLLAREATDVDGLALQRILAACWLRGAQFRGGGRVDLADRARRAVAQQLREAVDLAEEGDDEEGDHN